jgi:hypothetical protein
VPERPSTSPNVGSQSADPIKFCFRPQRGGDLRRSYRPVRRVASPQKVPATVWLDSRNIERRLRLVLNRNSKTRCHENARCRLLVPALATPALAEEVGVGVGFGPGGAGVTIGQSRDYDRDRDREGATVIKEREPTDRTTVIKKDHGDGTRSKAISPRIRAGRRRKA